MKKEKLSPLFCGLLLVAVIAISVTIVKNLGYHFSYAVTPSMPQGFYLISPPKLLRRYDIVEFKPPAAILPFIMQKHWVPQSGLLLKYVYGVPGDVVCIKNEHLFINGQKVVPVQRYYAPQKELPQTKFCGRLAANEYLLLSTLRERSFDGRYFGPVTFDGIIGRATPLYIKKQ